MLASITPLGERSRGSRWSLTVGWFTAGAVGAGALAGAALGAVGQVLPAGWGWRGAAAAGLVGLCVVLDGTPLRRGLPTLRRQVNEDWLGRYRGWVYGLGFGGQLGLGVATIVTSAAVYAAGLLCVLAHSVGAGALIGAVFGGVRALSLLPAAQVHEPASLTRLHLRLAAAESPVLRLTWAAELMAFATVVMWLT